MKIDGLITHHRLTFAPSNNNARNCIVLQLQVYDLSLNVYTTNNNAQITIK